MQQLAAAATELATAIMQGHEGVDLRALDQATAAVDDKLTGQQQVSQTSTQECAEVFELQGIAQALQVVTRQVHGAADILARVDRPRDGAVRRGLEDRQGLPAWTSSPVGCRIT